MPLVVSMEGYMGQYFSTGSIALRRPTNNNETIYYCEIKSVHFLNDIFSSIPQVPG